MTMDTTSALSGPPRASTALVGQTVRCKCGAPASHRASLVEMPHVTQEVCEQGARVLRGEAIWTVRRLTLADFA